MPPPHDYGSNFDSSHLDTLSFNAQVGTGGAPRPNPGPYHPSSGRVPPAGRHYIRRPTPGPENILFSDPARNHAGKKNIPTDDLIVDRFPRDDSEWDFANAPVCFATLKQHEIEHSFTSGQTSPDAVIKAEAMFANGLLKPGHRPLPPPRGFLSSGHHHTTLNPNRGFRPLSHCSSTRSQRPHTINRVS